MEHFKPSEIRAIARAEMDQWGLGHWKFAFNKRTTSLGMCSFRDQTIYLSTYRVAHDSKEDVINTLRHEIAHAVHYLRRGEQLFERKFAGRRWVRKIPPHGAEWKAIAREVGMTKEPSSRSSSNIGDNIDYKWILVLVVNDQIERLRGGYQRRPSIDFRGRYIPGRKRESMGNIYFVPGGQFKRFANGVLCKTRMQFFQKAGVQVNPFGG